MAILSPADCDGAVPLGGPVLLYCPSAQPAEVAFWGRLAAALRQVESDLYIVSPERFDEGFHAIPTYYGLDFLSSAADVDPGWLGRLPVDEEAVLRREELWTGL